MKTTQKLLLIVIFSFIVLNVTAQSLPLSFGVKAGVNLSNSSWDLDGFDKKAKIGFQVGVTGEYAIAEGFYLQSGLSFTTKGSKIEISQYSDAKLTVNQTYLQLPIYAAYKIDIAPATKIAFNVGPYFAYGLGGKTKIEGFDDLDIEGFGIDGKYDTYGSDGLLKRFDLGLGAGVSAEFGKIVVGINYELGLLNLANKSDGEDAGFKYKNRNASLTVGYKF